jgi:hypothetical protein
MVTETGTHPIVRASFVSWNVRFEGRILWPYLDAKGIPTAAIGIALPRFTDAYKLPWFVGSRPATLMEIATDWGTVLRSQSLAGIGGAQPQWAKLSTIRLEADDVDDLTLQRFDANDPKLAARWKCWPTFPADAQLIAHSMAYAMGEHRFDEFPKFCDAMEARDFTTAANESHMSELANAPLHPRNVADKNGLLNAAAVIAQGEPLDALLVQW